MRKNIFNFSPESIIEANTSAKFICTYKNWNIKKREDFIKTIGGNGNFKKLKNYFESKIKD